MDKAERLRPRLLSLSVNEALRATLQAPPPESDKPKKREIKGKRK